MRSGYTSSEDDTDEKQEILQKLDATLPANIGRRNFLRTTSAALVTGGLAGCSGNGNGNDNGNGNGNGNDNGNGNGDEGNLDQEATWRQPWIATMAWPTAHIAEQEEYFSDQGITAPTVENGEGSPDTARRVGTGEADVGISEVGSVMSGMSEGSNATIVGMARNRSLLSFTYRDDRMDSYEDLEGSKVALGSPFAHTTWPVVPDILGLDPEEIETEPVDLGVAVGQISDGSADAMYSGMIAQVPLHQQAEEGELDTDVTTVALNKHADLVGFPFIAYDDWLADSANHEYLIRVMEGYSEALKWALMNPEGVLDLMKNDINQELQAQDDQELKNQYRVKMAITVSSFIQDGGGLMDWNPDALQESFDVFGNALFDDESAVPAYDDVVDRSFIEEADLATLSSDEWDQVYEWAQPIITWFEP